MNDRAVIVRIEPGGGVWLFDATDESVCVARLNERQADRLSRDLRNAIRARRESSERRGGG